MGRIFKKKALAFLLMLAMVFSMAPGAAFANGSEAADSVTVSFTAQAENTFLCAPQFDAVVTADLAESYGYTDKVENGVSALDVLVKAHEVIFESDFTKDTKDNYLTVNENDTITKVFGTSTTSAGFTINGKQAHNDEFSGDENTGYYGAYTISEAVVNDSDFVEFAIYQDDYMAMDYYVWFTQNNEKLTALNLTINERIDLGMTGYAIGWYGSSSDTVIDKNCALTQENSYLENVQLAWIDPQSGIITDIKDATVDENSTVSLTAPAEAGTYYLTAYMPEEEIAEYATPIFMPLLTVQVDLPDASVTAPSDAEVFVGSKTKNYVPFTEISAAYVADNGDGTSTYYYDLKNGTYNYRISKEGGVPYAGKFSKTSSAYTLVVSEEDLAGDPKAINRDVSANSGYNVADIFLNINAQGYLRLEQGETHQIINLRNWEIVDNTVNNYFIEPDYHYTVLDENGAPDSDVVSIDEDGLLTAEKAGVAIVLVTYDAIHVEGAAGGPDFGAIWPENTGVFVVSVGAAEGEIETGITLNAGKNDTANKLAGDALDAEHDVIYFTEEQGAYTFTPETAGCAVAVANPTIGDTLTYDGFTAVTANEDGSYTVPLTEGRNIVKVSNGETATYQVITAKQVRYTINGQDPSEAILSPGDTVSIEFETLYHPANKLASVYNMSAYAVYTNVDGYEGQLIGSTSQQYKFASTDAAQTVNQTLERNTDSWGNISYKKGAVLTIPEDWDSDTFTLSGGSLLAVGLGDPYGGHRGITEEGKDTNFTASSHEAYLGQLPDITLKVENPIKIQIQTDGVKTDYYEGDPFDTTNLIVTAQYADGKTQVKSNYTVSPETLTKDTTEVTVSYGGQTAVIPVTVQPLKATAIEITKQPNQTEYTAGDTFDPTGMEVTVTYNNGKQETTTDYTYSPGTLSADDTEVTVTYNGTKIPTADDQILSAKVTVSVSGGTGGGNKNISVSFTLLGDSKHGDNGEIHTLADSNLETWIDTAKISVPSGSTVLDVLEKALAEAGIPYENPDGTYVTEIKGLAEMDNGSLSGWMYTLNGKHNDLSVSEQKVKEGDKIVFHWTDDYTKEEYQNNPGGNGGGAVTSDVDTVIDLIDAIGTVTADSGDAIAEARAAYDRLSAANQAKVTNYATLTDAEATYEKLLAEEILSVFTDVQGHWATDAIAFVVRENLFNGTSATTFEPNSDMTRAMLVTVLWRLDGEPAPAAENHFTDVAADTYYADAVAWAAENEIVTGYSDTTFLPARNISREELAVILYRYARYKGADTEAAADLSAYTDADRVSAYAADAMGWAVETGIINGRTETTLVPQGESTRAEVATMMQRFAEQQENA